MRHLKKHNEFVTNENENDEKIKNIKQQIKDYPDFPDWEKEKYPETIPEIKEEEPIKIKNVDKEVANILGDPNVYPISRILDNKKLSPTELTSIMNAAINTNDIKKATLILNLLLRMHNYIKQRFNYGKYIHDDDEGNKIERYDDMMDDAHSKGLIKWKKTFGDQIDSNDFEEFVKNFSKAPWTYQGRATTPFSWKD